MEKIPLQNSFLNPTEVSEQYGFSTSTLAKWRMNKINLKFYKIGKYIKYKSEEIEMFINEHKVEVS